MEKRLRTLLIACTLSGFNPAISDTVASGLVVSSSTRAVGSNEVSSSDVSSSSVDASKTKTSSVDKKSYAWQLLEKQLGIARIFQDLAASLQTGANIDAAPVTDRCRQLMNNCARLASSTDPLLAELVVASCAYSNQGSAIDLMDQVLDPRQSYPSSSWLAAMQYLSSQPSARACDLLIRCMGMPYLEINMASAYFLSQNGYARSSPDTVDRILAIQRRVDRQSWLWIVDFLAHFDHPQAAQGIRQIYFESDTEAQAAILQILTENPLPFDDLVSHALSSSSPSLLEGALYYILLNRSTPTSWLELSQALTTSRHERVATMALFLQLHKGQESSALEPIRSRILKGDLHAIAGCGLLARIHTEGLPSELHSALTHQLSSDNGKIQLQAAIALLEALNPAGLELLADLFHDNALLFTSSSLGSFSWPIYQIQWLPTSTDPDYPFSIAKQYQSRGWLLEKASRLPIDKLIAWCTQLVSGDEGSSHYLVSTHLSSLPNPQVVQLLQQWTEAPGKPWLRLGSHLSLWRMNRDRESLERLQDWMGKPSDSMIPFLSSRPQTGPVVHGSTWVGDFQTQVQLEIAEQLCQNSDSKSWLKICSRISEQAYPLEMLPLIALLSKQL